MKIQEYIMPICLSALMVFGLQYFFGGFMRQEQNDAHFTAPQPEVPNIPLKKTVQFEDMDPTFIPKKTVVTTHWGTIGLSSYGATVEYVDYEKFTQREINPAIRTIFPTDNHSKQKQAFLLAFEEKTPMNYTLIQEESLENKAIITYRCQAAMGEIIKQFVIFYDTYAVDLNIAIKMAKDEREKALNFVRLFFPAPHFAVTDFNDSSITTGLMVLDKNNKVEKSKDIIYAQEHGWFLPKMCGLENQHFVHMFYKDVHNNVSRVYYMADTYISDAILEMKPITQTATMNFSFYLGPKDVDAIKAVDTKMADLFGYKGILAPLYDILFKLLKFLYQFCGNFGLAIILLSLILKILLLPISISGHRNQKEQKEFDKKMNYITQKYKNDPDTLAIERAELLKTQGAMITSALLQFAINIPIFVCVNYMLGSTVELFNAPFLWIKDLSGYDPLYILPLCVGGSFLFQLSSNADAKKQLNMILLGLVVGALATRFSAGFGIYFVINTVLSVIQTYFLNYFGKKKAI